MSNHAYKPEEIEKLRANPNVKKVTAKQIIFTEEFKVEAVRLYHEGQTRREILHNAGFDVERMGKKKINKTLGNWLTKEKKGKPITSEKRGRVKENFSTPEEQIEHQKLEIQMLKQENDFLRQIQRLERRHQPQKSPSVKKTK